MKIYKINRFSQKTQKQFYHGSYDNLSNETILTPEKGNFMDSFSEYEMGSHFKLEQFRPSKYISRNKAVYMCEDIDDLDNCGAATEYIYEVTPLGKVEKHDLNWMSEIDLIMDDAWSQGEQESEETIEKVRNAALNYWNGTPHYNESLWEYLTTSAKIIKQIN